MPDAIVTQSNFDVNRLRVLVGDIHLVGALLMGDQTLSRAIHHLIVDQIDITPIREKLVTPGNSITDIIADYWAEIVPSLGRKEHAAVKS
jgi:translation initiation factor 6 (eIF-6)